MISKVSIFNQDMELGVGQDAAFQDSFIPDQQDANWFADAVQAPDGDMNLAERFLDQVHSVSENLKLKNEELNQQFEAGESTDSFVDMLSTLRQVSDYGFQTAMVAKAVSKGTQAFEKLTNMQ